MKTGNIISETPELPVYEASHLRPPRAPPPPPPHTHTHAPPRNNDFPLLQTCDTCNILSRVSHITPALYEQPITDNKLE